MSDERIIAAKVPVKCALEEGKNYAWCSCGRSDKQPFCNGAHRETSLRPMIFSVEASREANLCQCKQTKNPPYCDGSHRNC